MTNQQAPEITPWPGGECPFGPDDKVLIITRGCGTRSTEDMRNYANVSWQHKGNIADVIGYVMLDDIPRWAKADVHASCMYPHPTCDWALCDCGHGPIYDLLYDPSFPWGDTIPRTREEFYAKFPDEHPDGNGRWNGIITLYQS